MSSDEREQKIAAIVKRLDETPGKQYVGTVVRAAIELIPYVGGSFSTLMEELIRNWKMQRLQRFVAELALDFKSLGERVNLEYVKKEEFGYLFEQTFRVVLENYQSEKLEAFRNILLNSTVRTEVRQELKEYFLNLARNITPVHFRFISLLANPADYYRARGLQDERGAIGGSIMQELRKCFPEHEDATIRSVWNDLYNYGIVNTDTDGIGAMMSVSGSQALERRLSSFGQLFVNFIKSPVSD